MTGSLHWEQEALAQQVLKKVHLHSLFSSQYEIIVDRGERTYAISPN